MWLIPQPNHSGLWLHWSRFAEHLTQRSIYAWIYLKSYKAVVDFIIFLASAPKVHSFLIRYPYAQVAIEYCQFILNHVPWQWTPNYHFLIDNTLQFTAITLKCTVHQLNMLRLRDGSCGTNSHFWIPFKQTELTKGMHESIFVQFLRQTRDSFRFTHISCQVEQTINHCKVKYM